MALDESKPASDSLVSDLDTYGQETRVAVNLNTTHRTSDGSDHSFLDQSVTIGSSPTLVGTNFSSIPDTALSSGATVTSAGAGDSGKLVKLDASGKIDSTLLGSSIFVTDLDVTGLTVSELLRVNSGGTAVESAGVTAPTGDIVGTSDSQTLTNKTLTSPVLNTGVSGTAVLDEDDMATNSNTQLATQQSIKAYVDSGTVTMTNKTLTTPTITIPVIADFSSATHDHSDNANGGTLSVETTDLDVTGLTASQLIRLNSGGTALESSGKTVPTGTIVGTTDTQTLTNKTVDVGTFTGVQTVESASAPGGSPTDAMYVWSQDIVAGQTALHVKSEDGNVIKLYQIAGADQAALGSMTTVGANTGTSGAGLSLIGDTTLVNQASNIMNDFVALQEDIAALETLLSEIRSSLVSHGLLKGSA